MSNSRLVGDGTWNLIALVDGNDIVVPSTTATWFGGGNDPNDDGRTASGISTKANPLLRGCALPCDLGNRLRATKGSPIPSLPFCTLVEVTRRDTGVKIVVPMIDYGPAKSAEDGIDLTQEAFKALGANLRTGVIPVTYRILGGAAFVR